jgi:hypothetical protein
MVWMKGNWMLKWKPPEKLCASGQNHQPVNWGLIPQCIQPITTTNTKKKLLKLCPCKITGTQQLFPPEWETREQYCKWFHELVTNGSFGLERMIFLGKARLALNGNMQAGTITDTDVWEIPMQFTMFPCMCLHSQSSMHWQNHMAQVSWKNNKFLTLIWLILSLFFR